VSYLDELQRRLGEVGIRGPLRRRILAEFADHLECEPGAALGEPQLIANHFADELGTARAHRAAIASFAALAVAGALFTLAFLGAAGLVPSSLHTQPALLGDLGAALAALCLQVSFITGSLGALRAWRRRGVAVLSRADAVVIARRMAVAVGAGLATMIGLALVAVATGPNAPARAQPLLAATAGAGAVALLLALGPVLRAWRLVPVRAGAAGDLFDDLGPFVPAPLRGRPWRFAFVVAVAVAVVIALVGAVQDDGIDGALRGLLDGTACLAGFGILGRYLALRS
jgi:hypothetical protein